MLEVRLLLVSLLLHELYSTGQVLLLSKIQKHTFCSFFLLRGMRGTKGDLSFHLSIHRMHIVLVYLALWHVCVELIG